MERRRYFAGGVWERFGRVLSDGPPASRPRGLSLGGRDPVRTLNSMTGHAFRRNDNCGSPRTHDFGGDIGPMAPTTLRYIKILSDLETWFGSLGGKRVVEIGGGYGGQCAVIKTRFRVSSYTLIDLQPVLSL